MIFRNCYTKFHEPLGEWNLRQFWNITSGIYAKYHVQIMQLFVYTTIRKRFVIFTCRYFKLSWNTTALSQSNCSNFSCSSINNRTSPENKTTEIFQFDRSVDSFFFFNSSHDEVAARVYLVWTSLPSNLLALYTNCPLILCLVGNKESMQAWSLSASTLRMRSAISPSK